MKHFRAAEFLRSKDGQWFTNLQVVEQYQNTVTQCQIFKTLQYIIASKDSENLEKFVCKGQDWKSVFDTGKHVPH